MRFCIIFTDITVKGCCNLELDIIQVLKWIIKRFPVVIAFVLAAMAVVFVKVQFFTDYTYTSDCTLYINSKIESDDSAENVTLGELNSSRSLLNTYIAVMKTRTFLTDVNTLAGTGFSWGSVRGMLSFSRVDDTELVSVRVTAKDPEIAYAIAESLAQTAYDNLPELVGGSVEIVDHAVVPASANSKGLTKYLVIAFLVGAVLGAAFIVGLHLLDTTVRSPEEFAERYDLVILGAIPR